MSRVIQGIILVLFLIRQVSIIVLCFALPELGLGGWGAGDCPNVICTESCPGPGPDTGSVTFQMVAPLISDPKFAAQYRPSLIQSQLSGRLDP